MRFQFAQLHILLCSKRLPAPTLAGALALINKPSLEAVANSDNLIGVNLLRNHRLFVVSETSAAGRSAAVLVPSAGLRRVLGLLTVSLDITSPFHT